MIGKRRSSDPFVGVSKNPIIGVVKAFLLLICALGQITSYAQAYYCEYTLTARLDSTHRDWIHSEKMILYIDTDRRQSFFTGLNNFKLDSIRNVIEREKMSLPEALNHFTSHPRTFFHFKIWKDYRTGTTETLDSYMGIIKPCSYREALPFKWQLQADAPRIIKGYACQKAITQYGGRNYVAWYTTAIPIADGPYKFKGLPGLILEIYDTKKDYIFSLNAFHKSRKRLKLSRNKKCYPSTRAIFVERRREFYHNPFPTLKAIGMISAEKDKRDIKKKFNRFNNFIELE